LAGAKKLVDRDQVFAIVGVVGAPTTAVLVPYIAQAKVPMVAINGMPPQASRYGFGLQGSYSDLMYALTRYLVGQAKVKKLGYLFQNDDLGEFGRAGMMRALKELGAEKVLVANVGYERGATDYTTQVLRLKDAGAEAVIAMGTVGSVAAAIKQGAAIGYRPTWGTYAIGSSATMRKLVGDNIAGLTFAMETDSDTSDSPGLRKALQIVHKDYPDLKLDYNAMLGYAVAELTVKALEKAGRDLTRDKFVAAAESLGKYQGDVMSVSITPTKHTGADAVRIYQWKGDKVVPLTDPQPIGGASR
jgi:ABC-type branched-subunit amino acid transport system substrate-binding protein